MTFHNVLAEPYRALALETKAEGDPPPDPVTAALASLSAKMDEVLAKLRTDLDAAAAEAKAAGVAVTALETKMDRPGGSALDKAPTMERKAFTGFVRHGVERLPADEIKTLRVADDSKGGYLAPSEFTTELLRDLVQFSPVRQAARVGTMSVGEIKIPRRIKPITAQWVSEIEERPRTEPAYGMTELVAHEMSCYVDVSNQLLEDAAINIEAELSFDFAEEFGRLEGTAFVNGDGVKKPLGVNFDPTVPVLPMGSADPNDTPKFTDALIKLLYSLAPAYRNNGSWMMNGLTIGRIRGLKDSTGRFMWMDSLAEGQPPTLLGRPVVEAIDMPDATAGATPIIYGDIASAYRVYDRVGLSVLRNPFTLDVYGQTRFTARRRVAGSVVRPEAIRKLKISAN